MKRAAFGVRIHTGWAALVAIADPVELGAPVVLDRRRVEMIEAGKPDAPAFVYHAAAKLSIESAASLVRQTALLAQKRAEAHLATTVRELSHNGYTVVAAAVIASNSARPLPALESILKSHPLIHSAEGELYRRAVIAASEQLELSLTMVAPGELYARAAKAMGESADVVRRRLAEAKARVGAPWTSEQKECTLAALLALVT